MMKNFLMKLKQMQGVNKWQIYNKKGIIFLDLLRIEIEIIVPSRFKDKSTKNLNKDNSPIIKLSLNAATI